MVEAPGDSAPISLKPILVDMEGGCYIRPILTTYLADLISGRRQVGGGATSGGGNKKLMPKVGATGGMHECRWAMKRTCPPCPFETGRTRGIF